jgi:hypothetical protein
MAMIAAAYGGGCCPFHTHESTAQRTLPELGQAVQERRSRIQSDVIEAQEHADAAATRWIRSTYEAERSHGDFAEAISTLRIIL